MAVVVASDGDAEVILHKAGESEEAAPFHFMDCELEGGFVRTGLQVIRMNADDPKLF
jgi:hypothetical protein